mmetsp:Transcript_19889/g.50660  ORF Transcript_19889/g.50660 Transcript_19889/m.50660 type:complete len:333 (-) Transcript_19889:146-1144(-)
MAEPQTDHRGRPVKCTSCFREEPPASRFQRCGACKKTFYCNAACQKDDWQYHRSACSRPRMHLQIFSDRYEWSGVFPGRGKEDFEVRLAAGEIVVLGATDPSLVEDVLAFPPDAARDSLNASFRDNTLTISATRAAAPSACAPAATPPADAATQAAAVPPADAPLTEPPDGLHFAESAPVAEGAASTTNAVDDSIQSKGKFRNSKFSYYAQRPAEAPTAAKPDVCKITNYAFADDAKLVKVYIPWPGAQALDDSQVRLQLDEESGRLELEVDGVGQAGDECHSLTLLFFDRVTSAIAKRRADKMIITLVKLNPEREWLSLTRKAWETLPARP